MCGCVCKDRCVCEREREREREKRGNTINHMTDPPTPEAAICDFFASYSGIFVVVFRSTTSKHIYTAHDWSTTPVFLTPASSRYKIKVYIYTHLTLYISYKLISLSVTTGSHGNHHSITTCQKLCKKFISNVCVCVCVCVCESTITINSSSFYFFFRCAEKIIAEFKVDRKHILFSLTHSLTHFSLSPFFHSVVI